MQIRKQGRIEAQVAQIPLGLQCLEKTLHIAARFVHVGVLHFDVIQVHTGIERDVAMFGMLAHDLPMHLTFGWHIDDEVALDQCLAAQPPAFLERCTSFAESRFDFTYRRQVFDT